MATRTAVRKYGLYLRYLNVFILACCFIGTGLVAGALMAVRGLLPDAEKLVTYRPRLTTELYSTEIDAKGNISHTLLGRVFKEDREPVDLQDIPIALRQATIAIEDRPFYQHRGIDPKGILRAVWVNLRSGSLRQGGSTITQQLVRNMWLSRKKTLDRKVKEAILAVELERRYSKDEMLEMYLNQVYYGHGAYGVKVAARLFLDKNVKDLTLPEAALLAGLPRSPVFYSPYRHPDRAKQRRRQVLQAMVEMGYITAAQSAEAEKHQIQPNLAPLKEEGITAFRAPYFTHLVIRQLCEQYGVDTVYQGGLRVYTTLDMRLQKVAEKELAARVESLRRRGSIKGGLVGQGALAAVEVATGDVLALVGGVGPYDKLQFNRAYPGGPPYGRQPGSSFKPYVWASALEHGYGPQSVFSGSPISIRIGPGRYWSPKNYSPRQGGNYTLRWALAQSVNLVSVRVVRRLGPKTIQREAAKMLGIPEERLRAVVAIALGTSELAPLEQAIGYCTFASGGLHVAPRLIRSIENTHGDPIVTFKPLRRRVINPATAISMISMMRTVVTSGTGTRASVSGYEICGKTGTTQDGRDAWWVGFSPDLCCAVWVGNDDYKPMHGSSGGGFCAPVFARFMAEGLKLRGYKGKYPEGSGVKPTKRGESEKQEEEKEEEKQPSTVTVCTVSGGRATPYCPSTVERTLAPGVPPPPPCRIHGPASSGRTPESRPPETGPVGGETGGTRTVTVCAQSGQLAGPHCPQTVERSFPAGQGPTGVCTLHGPPSGSRPKPPPASSSGTGGGETPKPQPNGSAGGSDKPTKPPAGQ